MTQFPLTTAQAGITSELLQLFKLLGQPDFHEAFLTWVNQEFGSEQCMVFFWEAKQGVSTLMFRDYAREASAKRLAEAYVGQRQYLQDPNFACLKKLAPEELAVSRLEALSPNMSLEYRKTFFETPGFCDKLAILKATPEGHYYINLYRRTAAFDQRFDNPDFTRHLGELISLLLEKHFALNRSLRLQGPLAFLSEREQQVCRAVLQGKKNETIAAELQLATSSVITYRKRAYEKLGITSRAQLFSLCAVS
ncbi:helix-turn-helix transcriptional regulator [Marinospirillum perlucidum]|uniref:helix-turn-helix transcriptional regulator n=1 Tax=Marinospirillum perlucidum TaxID=1982602 RepID=UPI000DF3DD10|nr:LuxR C-terminal-related transcriptional regulator [Marinospirillum perlucidum]